MCLLSSPSCFRPISTLLFLAKPWSVPSHATVVGNCRSLVVHLLLVLLLVHAGLAAKPLCAAVKLIWRKASAGPRHQFHLHTH